MKAIKSKLIHELQLIEAELAANPNDELHENVVHDVYRLCKALYYVDKAESLKTYIAPQQPATEVKKVY